MASRLAVRATANAVLAALLIAALAVTAPLIRARADTTDAAPIPIRVVVVTTFEIGKDAGDTPGELQNWVEYYPLPQIIPFPQGYHHLRYNPDQQVLAIETGEGAVHGAASIMALGMDPRFDLTKAYWVVAAIAGVDPNWASVGSAAWAKYVVDGDLAYEIDARQIPSGWSTGYVPLGRSAPYQLPVPPANSLNGEQVFTLDPGFVDWAVNLTSSITLPDDATLQKVRSGYPDYPRALKPPFVLQGDDLAASTFCVGDKLNAWAENWITYWTQGKGRFVMTAEEDAGILQSLTFLSHVGRVDRRRVLVLRTASDYSVQPEGKTPAQFLASENNGGLSGFIESLNAAFAVGSRVVRELSGHWDRYADHIPSAP
ncbi:MAG TPA: purine nucleoside permease [Acetobacteraceae bacterium]|nr:purine nucleoside permease [Acetobacteraceae bacterium]